MTVSQVRSATKPTSTPVDAHAADLKTATKLKGAIVDALKTVRFGQPLPAASAPKQDSKGHWKAPNGDRLIEVVLSKPAAGVADGMSQSGFVNPKTNQFYEGTFGGIAGVRMFHGPLSLRSVGFKAKTFSAEDIAQLTAAANGKPTGAAKPATKAQIQAALGAYEFQHLVKWSAKGPKDSEVLKTIPLSKAAHPDGYNYTGLVLKSDPHKVVVLRTGGFAGLSQYTQTMDVTRLPK